MCIRSQFGVDIDLAALGAPRPFQRFASPAPRHRILDLFSSLHRIMSRVILLIVCALSVASCLVMQTGAMRSAGERPPQSRCSFSPRVRP